MGVQFAFDNSFARLPGRFFARQAPSPVVAPRLLRLNVALAKELGLDPMALATPAGTAILAGNALPEGAASVALAYAGHQFGHFSPQLGDGRAVLLGEVVDRAGVRRDVQLKGSGPTAFSRRGDGRAALGPVLREYIVSEAMAALGIPTTRSLAAVATGEAVRRETMLPGGVLTRVAASHIRVGTFQYFAAREDGEAVRLLADYAIARHYPEAAGAENSYRAFFQGVVARQAALVARWLHVGFIHGVMNTDNCSIAGETIDYGPCAFMDGYDPAAVFSSIDRDGRYAYGNQPRIAHWNLARLAECLLPLLHGDADVAVALAKEDLGAFGPAFQEAYLGGLRAKIGLTGTATDGDEALVEGLLEIMAAARADFTLTFRGLADLVVEDRGEVAAGMGFADPAPLFAWAGAWRARLAGDGIEPAARAAALRAVNPLYIPRNHMIEAAIVAAVERDDLAPFEALCEVLASPFARQPGRELFAAPPRPDEVVHQTFCGT